MLIVLLALVGCASSNSCEAYVEAAGDCASTAGADASAYDKAVICGDWTAEDEATYGDWYTCRTEAIEAGDCSTTDGLDAALVEAEACAQP